MSVSTSTYIMHETVLLETETEYSFTETAFQVGAVVFGFDRYFILLFHSRWFHGSQEFGAFTCIFIYLIRQIAYAC